MLIFSLGKFTLILNIKAVVVLHTQCRLSNILKDGLLQLAPIGVVWSHFWLYVGLPWLWIQLFCLKVSSIFFYHPHISEGTLQVLLCHWTRYEISLGKPNSRSFKARWRAHNTDVSGTQLFFRSFFPFPCAPVAELFSKIQGILNTLLGY